MKLRLKTVQKLGLFMFIVLALAAFFILGGQKFLSLDYLKTQKDIFKAYYETHVLGTIFIFFMSYVVATALSFPGATIMTLAAGAIFGVGLGTIIVSFASAIGAAIAFLSARFLLRDFVKQKFGGWLHAIDEGVKRDGAFYLFTLRLIPAVPFFVINLAMGLTAMSFWRYFFVSQIGMLAGTVVYVNAGTQLAKIDSLKGILSPGLILSFLLLSIFPFLARSVLGWLKNKQLYAHFKRPKSFDYNVLVIGGGSAGLVSAYIAATVKSKVALIEKHKMGGDCLNYGCVPSKALIQSARITALSRRAKDFGMRSIHVEFSFADVMERVQSVIREIQPHDSVERYQEIGVECFQGTAKLVSPFEVDLNGKRLTSKNIILATGAEPIVPRFPGLESVSYVTTDTLWDIREQPKRFLVLGGGPIGCELAQAFARLGSEVTMVEQAPRLLIKEDPDVSKLVEERFIQEDIRVYTSLRAESFEKVAGNQTVICRGQGGERRLAFDLVLFALGRRARTKGFGLRELGVKLSSQKTLEVNDYLQATYPNIYACGDLVGPYQFTHVAAHQAWFCAVNALFSPLKKFKVDYRVIPWCTFTDPEVARVGLNETEAQEQNVPYEVFRYEIDDLDRAIADSENHGMVKVLTIPGKDKILGACIVGAHSGELITEFVAAMKNGYGMNRILETIHVYPTFSEANKYAAGVWKKAKTPKTALRLLEKFHSWRRG